MLHADNVHNALSSVKSKRTLVPCKMHRMAKDLDIPEVAARLRVARETRGFETAKAAAKYFGWKYTSYSQHERGERGLVRSVDLYSQAFRVSSGWLMYGEGDGPAIAGNGKPNRLPAEVAAGIARVFESSPDLGDLLLKQIEPVLQIQAQRDQQQKKDRDQEKPT